MITTCVAFISFAAGWWCSQVWRRRVMRRKLEALFNDRPFDDPEEAKDRWQER